MRSSSYAIARRSSATGGTFITTETSSLTTADLVRHMVGRTVSLFPKVETPIGEVLLEVKDLTRIGVFRDVGFRVHAGEIVGFAGLVGAGRTEVARVLFGIDRRDAGEVRLGGTPVDFDSPSAAMHAGIAYLPEDRHQEGLVLDFSIAQNVTLPILPRLFPRFLVRSSAERAVAREYTEQFNVRMTGVDQLVGALSGGNQQKVVLAKWLASKPTVLILDEPTRGIDIGAKVEVHRIISELAASGLGIILISSDLPEVLAMSDRILVLHEGRITAEIPRERATEERVHVRRDRQRCRQRRGVGMPLVPPGRAQVAESGVAAVIAPTGRGRWFATLARQRELSLVAIMFVLGALVSIAAPQFLLPSNLTQVAVLASVIAVAAVGEALVVITRNVDLSVEAMIGPGRLLARQHPRAACAGRPGGDRLRDRAGTGPRDDQWRDRDPLQGPRHRRDPGDPERLPWR